VWRGASAPPEYVTIKRLALTLAVVALACAADGSAGGIADQPCGNVAGENTNTCPPGEVGTPYSVRFVEEDGSGCGPGRQTFHLDSGQLPPGLALATDGVVSGVPTQPGIFRFYVEMREPQDDPASCAGKRTQKQFTLGICDRLAIVSAPALPPRAEARVPFRMSLSWCGGVGKPRWRVSAGGLPAGLTLRPVGSIAGVPTVAGSYRFAVTATDIRGRAARYAGTISVAPRMRLRTQRIPAARVGRIYRATLRATGGVAPRNWTIGRGHLPHGLRLDPALGVLVGRPTTAGTHRITVEARDELDAKAQATVTIVVLASPQRSHTT
jgi:large repetitive protein